MLFHFAVLQLQQWCCGGCYFGGSAAGVTLKWFCCGNGGILTMTMCRCSCLIADVALLLWWWCYRIIPPVSLNQQHSVVAAFEGVIVLSGALLQWNCGGGTVLAVVLWQQNFFGKVCESF